MINNGSNCTALPLLNQRITIYVCRELIIKIMQTGFLIGLIILSITTIIFLYQLILFVITSWLFKHVLGVIIYELAKPSAQIDFNLLIIGSLAFCSHPKQLVWYYLVLAAGNAIFFFKNVYFEARKEIEETAKLAD